MMLGIGKSAIVDTWIINKVERNKIWHRWKFPQLFPHRPVLVRDEAIWDQLAGYWCPPVPHLSVCAGCQSWKPGTSQDCPGVSPGPCVETCSPGFCWAAPQARAQCLLSKLELKASWPLSTLVQARPGPGPLFWLAGDWRPAVQWGRAGVLVSSWGALSDSQGG